MYLFNHKKSAPLFAAVIAMAFCFSGCGGKITRQEAAPAAVAPDTPPETSVPETPVTLTDERDGETYGTVKMPGGKTWMARNLNYTPQEGKSWCYDNDESNCEKYGRLYDWETAMKACPAGWRLPTFKEWEKLSDMLGGRANAGEKLKSKSGWTDEDGNSSGNGTDEFGFTALPSGYRNGGDDGFHYVGSSGYWWTATNIGDGDVSAYYMTMIFDAPAPYHSMGYGDGGKISAYPVRCVQEAAPAVVTPDTPPKITVPKTSVTFTDARDGKTYGAVKIGKQTWMAENLNYAAENSSCYETDESKCAEYGRLYKWDAAKNACPEGWHLPSRKEWKDLVSAAGGENAAGRKLKSNGGWKDDSNHSGTDSYGFSALPGGACNYNEFEGDFYYSIREHGNWWTATEFDESKAYHRTMGYDDGKVKEFSISKSVLGFSARCVKND